MWNDVQNDLSRILGSNVFKTLAGDSGYVHLFRNAGFAGALPPSIDKLPPANRQKLQEAARMCAQLLTMHVDGLSALRERRAKAVVITGPTVIYRLWSQRQQNRIGPWWFTQGIMQQAVAAAGTSRAAGLEWLRDRLAISLDWSDCDRVAQLTLLPSDGVPAVEAWGLPMRQYSPKAPGNPAIAMKDYWAKYGQMFQGQKTQYFLPFIPASRVSDHW